MPAPQLRITIAASMRATNGVEVDIDERAVVLTKPGPQGGRGIRIDIPLSDWDAIVRAVAQLREAITSAKSRIEPEPEGAD